VTLKTLVVILAILFVFLQYKLWFADDGVQQTQALQARIAKQQEENTKVQHENQDLNTEIVSLKKNPNEVEGLARDRLGMVKQGETYYQFVKQKP